MTALVTITVPAQSKNDAVEYYESLGMSLERHYKIDRDTVSLSFRGDKDLSAAILQSDSNASGELEFEDGTTSPLYVRRGPSWD